MNGEENGNGALAAWVADTIMDWRRGRHPAGDRSTGALHVGLLDELTGVVHERTCDHPMPVRLRLSDGDFDGQVRHHITGVLHDQLKRDPAFERRVRDLMEAVARAAVGVRETRAVLRPLTTTPERPWYEPDKPRRSWLGRRPQTEKPSVFANPGGDGA